MFIVCLLSTWHWVRTAVAVNRTSTAPTRMDWHAVGEGTLKIRDWCQVLDRLYNLALMESTSLPYGHKFLSPFTDTETEAESFVQGHTPSAVSKPEFRPRSVVPEPCHYSPDTPGSLRVSDTQHSFIWPTNISPVPTMYQELFSALSI